MLSHAEIESYLEDWAKEIARAAEIAWSKSSKVTTALAFLLAANSERILVPDTYSGPKAKDSPQRFKDTLVKVFREYYEQIKDNHGIKEKNVLKLFVPLGIPGAALGSTLLPNLDNLGERRGVHAHHSAKAVASVLDPETEHKNVTTVVNELLVLDGWLATHKRSTR